jgi:hypothetical protein
MYQIIADGIAWVDPDGNDTFTLREAEALADMLERNGYEVTIEGPLNVMGC